MLVLLNALLLLRVPFIPFLTALLDEYPRDERESRTAVLVNSGTLSPISVIFNLL